MIPEKSGFYYVSDNGPFVIGSETVCGQTPLENRFFNLNLKEDDKNKLIKFVVYCSNLKATEINPEFPSCSWMGGVFAYTGYGTLNRNIIKHLVEMGANVRLLTQIDKIDIPLEEAKFLAQKTHCNVLNKYPIVWGSVQSRESLKRHVVHYTMSETDGFINGDFIQTLSRTGEVWVPTNWDKEKFINSGVTKLIKIMPLGVDEQVYKPSIGEVIYTSGTNKFVFLTVSAWNWRKGYDVLLKAYFRSFSSKDDVSLVFITREGEGKRDVDKELPCLLDLVKKENCPHVVVSKARISDSAMPYVYSNANVFVLMSCGEGWGLPYCEAAACGLPIIGSNHGGQMAFLKEEDSFLVKPDRIVDSDESMMSWSNIYVGTRFADFSDSAIDEISHKMRWVYENYSEAKRLSNSCSKRVSEEFTWKNSAIRVYNRLVEIQRTIQ